MTVMVLLDELLLTEEKMMLENPRKQREIGCFWVSWSRRQQNKINKSLYLHGKLANLHNSFYNLIKK
jgi:hypothetical protein